MELVLPRTLGTRNLAALYSLCGQVLECADATITLNASEVEFIDPHGLAVLGALFNRLDGRRIEMPWLQRNHAGYMSRMDFFEHFEVHDVDVPDWNRADRTDRLVELTCVRSSADTDTVANRLADAITGQLTNANPHEQIDPVTGKNEYMRYRHPIWYSLSELLENSVTHAKMHGHLDACVWVAAQYYERNGEVKMSVVDDGCGILRSLANHPELGDHTHFNAIRAALKPKVSCNRDSPYFMGHGNQGVGLTTTMRIAKAAKGRLFIATGNAAMETGEMRGGEMPDGGRWNGVAIAFSCRRHALPAVNLRNLLPVETPKARIPINFVD